MNGPTDSGTVLREQDALFATAHIGSDRIAVAAGEIMGFAAFSKSGEVLLCYVIPEARFTDTGRAMLFSTEQLARDSGVLSLHLKSTLTARSFLLLEWI